MKERYPPLPGRHFYLAVDKGIVETRRSRLILGCRIYHPSRPRPIQRTQTHRTGLTGCIHVAPGQLKISQLPASIPHGHDLGMSRRVIGGGHFITAPPDNPSFFDDDTPERTADTTLYSLPGQLNRLSQVFLILLIDHLTKLRPSPVPTTHVEEFPTLPLWNLFHGFPHFHAEMIASPLKPPLACILP